MGRAQRTPGGPTRRSRLGRAARLTGLSVGVAALTTGCSVEEVLRFGWPVGVTPQAESMRHLWTYSAIAALVVGAIAWGAMFWSVTFHRKRRDQDDTPPRQTQYNLPVEIVFTVVPTIIVAVLFGFTVNVQSYVNADVPGPDLRVGLIAKQWSWSFTYGTVPDKNSPECAPTPTAGPSVTTVGDPDTVPILVLPTERRIEFAQCSVDVIHAFWVPEFLFKRDVFPLPGRNDQDNVWQIDRIDREGAFVGRCAELCGTYHAFMNFEVRALRPALYDQWVALRGQTNPATGAPFTTGEALAALQARGCDPVLCAPESTTTRPFATDRTQRSAPQPVAAGN